MKQKQDEKRKQCRMNLTLDPAVMRQLEIESEKVGISKSAFVSLALMQKFSSDKALSVLPEMMQQTTKLLKSLSSDDALTVLKSSELKSLVDSVSEASETVGQTLFANL